MPRTFSAASALTWENHDCLVNTSGIWVLLTCPLKAEGAAQSTRGFGTQSCPSPVPWLSPAAPHDSHSNTTSATKRSRQAVKLFYSYCVSGEGVCGVETTAQRGVILRVINSCRWNFTHSMPCTHTHTHTNKE